MEKVSKPPKKRTLAEDTGRPSVEPLAQSGPRPASKDPSLRVPSPVLCCLHSSVSRTQPEAAIQLHNHEVVDLPLLFCSGFPLGSFLVRVSISNQTLAEVCVSGGSQAVRSFVVRLSEQWKGDPSDARQHRGGGRSAT